MFVTAINRQGKLYNYTVYSDDNGTNWNVSELAFSHGDEAKVTELGDGTILMSIRRNGERGYNYSTDGGETWGTQGLWSELSTNSCNGDILNYTLTSDGYDTNRLIHSLPINDGTNARKQISIYLSYDEGKTWTRKKTLFPGNSAYSTMVKFEDGTIGIYAEDQRSGTCNYFMRFSLSWLTDGEDEYVAPTNDIETLPESNGIDIYAADRQIIIDSTEKVTIEIYLSNGMMYKAPFQVKGNHSIDVPTGLYIVKANNSTKLLNVK